MDIDSTDLQLDQTIVLGELRPFAGARSDIPNTPVRDRTGRPRSEILGLFVLLVGTAVAYMWDLSASGYSNSFYAAAVQAGTKSWKAFFFGSLDSSNFITVDKPPASLWVMELSGRIFGFNSLSMLIPEALEGVATVALTYAIIRRWYGHRVGLIAGVLMATTPVAALMFRFNNPDALLVLLLTAAAYCVTRALEKASTRWILLAGVAIGFAFLTKMGQALLVVPGFGGAYLIAAPTSLRRRAGQLVAALAAVAVSAGWWVLIVTVWPADARPMIDGSPTNSIWNLIVGYNGLDRLVSGTSGGGNFSGAPGLGRLFNSLMGGQASWLLPAAMLTLVAGLALRMRAPRTDRFRASLILWGGWLVVTGAVFSYSQGIIHTYYTVALAPAIAALVAVGVAMMANRWNKTWTKWAASALVAITAAWAVDLLGRSPHWNPWLRPLIITTAALAVAGLIASSFVRSPRGRRMVTGIAVGAAAIASIGGPAAYALQTVSTATSGALPSAGPATSAASAFGGGGGRVGEPSAGGFGSAPSGSVPQGGRAPSGTTRIGPTASSSNGGGTQVSAALVAALKANAAKYRWVAATDGSQNAASIELASGGEPVMAIGGFDGEGGNLSLAQFEKYVTAGDIHYFITSGATPGVGAGRNASSSITAWVESHFTAKTIGGETVYDLTTAAS